MEEHRLTASGRHWVGFHRAPESMWRKLIRTADMMQQVASDINKMKRSLLIDPALAVLSY